MDYLLTEEQQMLRDLARQITAERIKPVRAELDEQETFPWDIIKDLAQADLCGTIIPEAYGGLGMGCLENVLVLEALAEGCVGVATTYAASFLGAYPLLLYGNEEQKQKYLPPLAQRGNPGCVRADRSPGRQRRRGHPGHCRQRRRPLCVKRHQAVDHQRRRGRNQHHHRAHRQVQGRPGGQRLSGGKGR
jgi:hypothetical protein